MSTFCKVEYYRAGPSASGNVESTRYSPGDVFGVPYLVRPFRNRLRNAYHIYFLKSIGTEQRSAHLTGDDYQRSAVKQCIGYACDGVGGCRTRSDQAYAYFSRNACIALSGVGSSLLVTGENMIDFIRIIVKSIEYGHDCAAGIPENGVNSFVNECLHECMCTVHDLFSGSLSGGIGV